MKKKVKKKSKLMKLKNFRNFCTENLFGTTHILGQTTQRDPTVYIICIYIYAHIHIQICLKIGYLQIRCFQMSHRASPSPWFQWPSFPLAAFPKAKWTPKRHPPHMKPPQIISSNLRVSNIEFESDVITAKDPKDLPSQSWANILV